MNKVKWRRENPEKWNEAKKLNYARGAADCFSKGHKWSPDEDQMIKDPQYTDRQLNKLLGRSVQAIQVRRSRIS